MKENIFKCISADAWGFNIVNTETCELTRMDKKHVHTLAKKEGVEGVTLDGKKLVSIKEINHHDYAQNATVDFDVLLFFNRLCLELDDIPKEVERFVNCINTSTHFLPDEGMSHGDYAQSLAIDYEKVRKNLPPQELYNIFYKKMSKFTEVFNEFLHYANRRYEKTPDSYYDKLLQITGLPNWYKPLLKMKLYSLK